MTKFNPEELTQERLASLTNSELTSLYLQVRKEIRELIGRAERMSRGSGGIPSTGNRMFWASVLFTRIVITAKSLYQLLPNPKPRQHWDFSAAASLARNLLEACLVYHWLCGEGIHDEVRAGRFILFHLHDYGSRRRLFPEEFNAADGVFDDLVRQFDANAYLATFDDRRRKAALKGDRTPFIQDDVLAEMDVDPVLFRMLYRFFSQHTHTGPLAFYRMLDHDRGAGVETRHEKSYMIMVMGFSSDFLIRAMGTHLDIFPDAETRPVHLTARQIEVNVEEAQGRRRPKRTAVAD